MAKTAEREHTFLRVWSERGSLSSGVQMMNLRSLRGIRGKLSWKKLGIGEWATAIKFGVIVSVATRVVQMMRRPGEGAESREEDSTEKRRSLNAAQRSSRQALASEH